MAMNQHAANLVDITAKAFNGNVTSISPTDGISLIDSWIAFLKSDDQSVSSIANSLNDLKAELQSGDPNEAHLQQILGDLAKQTKQIANTADSDSKPGLTTLTEALEGFGQQISGVSGPAATGGQAPMTSTVGGESTNSGPGASAFNTSDSDLSNRNGGTVSNESTVDTDNTTRSDGGSVTNRSSEDDDYTNDSQRDNNHLSRSDTSRLSGLGVSGGTGDTDSSQSGGRSQY